MHYISTRGEAPVLTFDEVLLAGLARDGGLYVPKAWPKFSNAEIAAMSGRPYHDIATSVIYPYVGDTIARDDLAAMSRDAYSTFGHAAVTPLVQIAPDRFVLELFHGPTLAFKDVAMQLLARMMDHVLARRDGHAAIVGATSGDTGGAAIEAFRSSKRASVTILYPQGRVSDVQRRMMTTPQEPSVSTLAIDGTFDDCQALVKAMFNDLPFRDRVGLSGVNSINWARIAPQIAYYFAAGVALGAPHREVSFVVPTGNFGDIFAGLAAKRMGLPIDRLVIASNDNDILPRTVASGAYEKRGVVATTSPSMDIQVSSNFERYLFECQGRNADVVRAQMASLAQSGRFEVYGGGARLQAEFDAVAADEATVARVIRETRDAMAYVVEPHTACAVHAADVLGEAGRLKTPAILLATAHPAKFPDAMEEITGERPALPERLAHLLTDQERTTDIANDLAAVQHAVTSASERQSGRATPS
ncbi:MAG: threonine synthase [Pseudomonadota bacterium]